MNPAPLRKLCDRRPGDAYYTPDDVAFRCALLLIHDISGATVLDPQVGGGAWARAARSLGEIRRPKVLGALVPLATLASEARREWWERFPPAEVHVLSRRPSFTEDGKTDGRDYAFVIWRGPSGACRLGWIGGAL